MGRSEACEAGRRCQDSVGVLEGMALEGEALFEVLCLASDSGATRDIPKGEEFSFVVDVEPPVNLSIASSTPMPCCASDCVCGSILEENDSERGFVCTTDVRALVGVFAGEDFVGDIDLARSTSYQ